MNKFIPVSEPVLNGNEKKYVMECLDTGWISSEGPFVKEFENKFAEYLGRKYAVAVTNGTAAIDAAIEAMGIKEGDEVIMPTFTIISSINQIVRAGAIPVLIDCEIDTWNMDVNLIEERITSRTKAIMVVHIYGLPVDMDPVLKLAEEYNLLVIEDAAEAIGQTYNGKKCGTFGNVSTFSFYTNKLITTGEGGMIVTDDEMLAERCRSLRNLCFQPENRFVHEHLGWNLRMTNMQAALGLAQLETLEDAIEKRRKIGNIYNKLFKDIDFLQLPLQSTNYAENIYWVYGLVLNSTKKLKVKNLMSDLAKNGVGTRPFFWPMHKQPIFKKMQFFQQGFHPNSEKLSLNGFYIPTGNALTQNEQKEIFHLIIKSVNQIA